MRRIMVVLMIVVLAASVQVTRSQTEGTGKQIGEDLKTSTERFTEGLTKPEGNASQPQQPTPPPSPTEEQPAVATPARSSPPASAIRFPVNSPAADAGITTVEMSILKWIGTGGGIGGICLSPDASSVYAAYWGNSSGSPVEEYDTTTGERRRSFQFDDRHCHGDAVISRDGRYLFTPNYYFTHASRIDLEDGRESGTDVGGVRSAVWAGDIDITPDGQLVTVAVGRDGRNYDMKNDQVSIMDVSGGRFDLAGEVKLPDEPRGHKMGFTKDSQFAYVVTYPRQSSAPRLYELKLTQPFGVTRTVDFPDSDLAGVAVCDKFQKIYVSDTSGKKIWVVDAKTLETKSAITLEGAAPGTICLSPDNCMLFALSPATRSLWAVDAKTDRVLRKLPGLKREPCDIEIAPDNGTVYVAHRGEEGGICVVQVRRTFAEARAPRTPPTVVFSSDREGNYQIFKMPLNGGGVTRLTENNATEGAPRWSPDGKKIAFISDRDGPCRVFIMDGNGGNAAAIPNTDPTPGDVNAGVPLDWSPDGNSLVFVNKDHTAIRVVNADGSGLRTIVEGKIGKGYGYYHGVCWRQPNKIVFNVQNPSWGYDQDVFAVAPRDGQLTQITDEWGQYGHCMAPDLSPDGNSIVILRQPEKDPPPRSIFVMTAEGRDLRNLTRTAQMDAAPRWSPDGNRIVFCSGTMGKKHIWLMNADGSEQLQLTKGDSDDIQPDIR